MAAISAKRRGLLLAVGAILIGAIVYVFAIRHPGSEELTLYGNIDIREVTVGFRVAGRLAALRVDEGDAVRAGQELARLDATPLQLE